jgi:hypothetical protein
MDCYIPVKCKCALLLLIHYYKKKIFNEYNKKTLLVSLLSMPCVASENSVKTSEIESRIMRLTITPFSYNVYKSYKDLGYFKE